MSQPRTPLSPDSLQRTRFFPGQIINPPDFVQDRDYLVNRLRRHNRLLHGAGVVRGLSVEPIPAKGHEQDETRRKFEAFEERIGQIPFDLNSEEGIWLTIWPGYAITPLGDEIFLWYPMFVNITEEIDGALVSKPSPSGCCTHSNPRKVERADHTYYLIVEAYESELLAVKSARGRCGDHPEQLEFSRIQDTVRFKLVSELPALPDECALLSGHRIHDDVVTLCRFTIQSNQVSSITNATQWPSVKYINPFPEPAAPVVVPVPPLPSQQPPATTPPTAGGTPPTDWVWRFCSWLCAFSLIFLGAIAAGVLWLWNGSRNIWNWLQEPAS